MRLYRAIFSRVCAGVEVNEKGKIVETAPVLRAFLGQRLGNLQAWVARRGGRVEEVKEVEVDKRSLDS